MARKNAVDREFDKIAAAAPPVQPAVSDVAVRPKTLPELAAEYDMALTECRTLDSMLQKLQNDTADAYHRLEEARARRTAVWRAIEQIHGAAG